MINNREDANKYYQIVNELVDDYIDKWKIKPSNLRRYLKPGGARFNKFLERNKLSDIKGADKVLKDIIEDREHMERDGVITFESFKLFESDDFKIKSMSQCLYKGIEKAGGNMEKVLADYFDSSLGQIDIVDANKHIFKVNDWESDSINVIIYTDEEVDIMTDNFIEHLYGELSNKKIELTSSISIEMNELVNRREFGSKMLRIFNGEFTIKTITSCLDGYVYKGGANIESKDSLVKGSAYYVENGPKYYIWVKK